MTFFQYEHVVRVVISEVIAGARSLYLLENVIQVVNYFAFFVTWRKRPFTLVS